MPQWSTNEFSMNYANPIKFGLYFKFSWVCRRSMFRLFCNFGVIYEDDTWFMEVGTFLWKIRKTVDNEWHRQNRPLTARRGKGLSNRKTGGAGPGGRLLAIPFRGKKAVLVLPRERELLRHFLRHWAAKVWQKIMFCFRIGTSWKKSSHAHKAGSWYLLEVLFKISD